MSSEGNSSFYFSSVCCCFFILVEAEFYVSNSISMECNARREIEAVAERLSALAVGNLLGPAGRHGADVGLLEPLLEREEAVVAVSSLDERDSGVCGEERGRRTLISHLSQAWLKAERVKR
jgi:hypothetical protein